MRDILQTAGWNPCSFEENAASKGLTWVEDGGSFLANARIKARLIHKASGQAVLADDSGLCVLALEGAPGVESAYFAGPQANDQENRSKLLFELRDTPSHLRTAFYICVLCFINSDGKETIFWGRCDGFILTAERGQSGFGYDPLFYHPILQKSFAESTAAEKNLVSHRGKALAQFLNLSSALRL